MEKLDTLLNDDIAAMANALGCSEIQARRVKKAIGNGTYAIRILGQIRAIYANYGLRPDELIKYRDDN